MLAEAEGQRAIVDAENSISPEIIGMKVKLEQINAMPNIISEMVKPAEKIESIRIHQLGGSQSFMNGGGGDLGGPPSSAEKPVVNQAIDSILGMSLQLPALKEIGREIGVSMSDGVEGLMGDISSSYSVEQKTKDLSETDTGIASPEAEPVEKAIKAIPDPKSA